MSIIYTYTHNNLRVFILPSINNTHGPVKKNFQTPNYKDLAQLSIFIQGV